MEQLSWHTSHSGLFSTISSAFLTNLCLLSVIIPNRGLLKSSTMIVHLSIYPCNSVSFCFAYFDAVSWTNLWLVWPFGGLSIYCYVISHFIPISAISEKAMAPHSSTLAWKLPWMEEPGRLQSMGSLRVGHDWVASLSLFTFMHWRRKWQPTPVFLPGDSQGWGSLVGCRLWGRTESDTTEAT